METLARIRRHFLYFFEKHDHRVVPSSPLVPKNDPTLMFTNAGMVPFKNYFTGLEKPDYLRAVSVQKCVRAGGKHNDLENVGYTARHHTFFEMLGNFSFGDYFKEQAITFAWDLVHHQLGIAKDKLLVTVFHEDTESAHFWKKIAGLPEERIIPIATSDNFWSMGDTGPCGPCSEIFYDHGDHIFGGPPGSAHEDGDRFVEIWNLVFMQYEQLPEGRVLLPKPSIDTGSGLERLAAVLQGVHNNYDIDLFKNLIAFFEDAMSMKSEGPALTSFRVMADHLRSCAFLLADGVSPSNEGRGYVLRRIMRRAMRHGYMLGVKEPIMHRLVPALVKEMGEAYPELVRAQNLITETLLLEETRFRATLGRGLKLLEDETSQLSQVETLPGAVAFKLYDTYGFPLDLTQDILRTQGKCVDVAGFDQAMDAQRTEARKSWVGSGARSEDTLWLEKRGALGATEFLGYEALEAEAQIQLLVKDGQEVAALTAGEEGWLLLNQTPFYGESGGQMGDKGFLKTLAGAEVHILDTQKRAEVYHVHHVRVLKGILSLKEAVRVSVDKEYRQGLQAHHSATHLLHAVLRRHLGEQVAQKGSLVAYDRLRFDFSYPQALNKDQVCTCEAEVNRLIRENSVASTRLMAPEAALQTGAMALFGEKYGEEVRVVSMGEGEDKNSFYSIEFCGGTHVARTGDIGFFKILSESGVAAGIRRIEAVAGKAAELHIKTLTERLTCIGDILKTSPERLVERLEGLIEERKNLEKENKGLQQKLATSGGAQHSLEMIGSIHFMERWFEDMPVKELKGIAETLGKQVPSSVLVAGTGVGGKASVVVYVSAELTSHISAVDLVQQAATALGGQGGGGRPDMAQAGGTNPQEWPKAISQIKESLRILGF